MKFTPAYYSLIKKVKEKSVLQHLQKKRLQILTSERKQQQSVPNIVGDSQVSIHRGQGKSMYPLSANANVLSVSAA
jgi:hypothetical protein